MTILNGYTNATPHHRQNRRRERPGSRARRTISRKSIIHDECEQGILDARDSTIPLPSDKARPSPLLRQYFDQSWRRWNIKQAGETAQAELSRKELEQKRVLLFGGEVDDDELFRLGILYYDDEGQKDANVGSCDVPVRRDVPMFVMRPSRGSRRRHSKWRFLPPLYLSFSEISDDSDIAPLLSPTHPHNTPTIQHRKHIFSTQASIIDTPQSLPESTPALSFPNEPHFIPNNHPASPTSSLQEALESEDWTFITGAQHVRDPFPSSEPETWILCDDS